MMKKMTKRIKTHSGNIRKEQILKQLHKMKKRWAKKIKLTQAISEKNRF